MHALILIDIQNDYFPNGAMPLVNMQTASKKAANILDHARNNSLPVIHIQHISNRDGASFFLPGTNGAEIHSSVAPTAQEKNFIKHYPNAFRETKLLEHFRQKGIQHLIFCGAMTHMCIDTTVRAAFDYGFKCSVIADACATKELEWHGDKVSDQAVQTSFLAALNYVFADILCADELIQKDIR